MQRAFDFINVSNPSDYDDPEHKRQVRVQSMRAFRRTERVERIQRLRSEQLSNQRQERAHLPSTAGDMPMMAITQSAHFDVELMDPFNAMSLNIPGDQQSLLAYCAFCFLPA